MASSPRLSSGGLFTLSSSPTQDVHLQALSSAVGPIRGTGAGVVKKAPSSMTAMLAELVIMRRKIVGLEAENEDLRRESENQKADVEQEINEIRACLEALTKKVEALQNTSKESVISTGAVSDGDEDCKQGIMKAERSLAASRDTALLVCSLSNCHCHFL